MHDWIVQKIIVMLKLSYSNWAEMLELCVLLSEQLLAIVGTRLATVTALPDPLLDFSENGLGTRLWDHNITFASPADFEFPREEVLRWQNSRWGDITRKTIGELSST